jgi:hypothetical protein
MVFLIGLVYLFFSLYYLGGPLLDGLYFFVNPYYLCGYSLVISGYSLSHRGFVEHLPNNWDTTIKVAILSLGLHIVGST